MLSPGAVPPSPAVSVMPGVMLSASRSDVTPCACITARGMTTSVCGVSISGCVYFGEEAAGAPPLTSTNSDTSRTRSVTPSAVNTARTDVPASSACIASCIVNAPDTPGDGMMPNAGSSSVTLTPATRANAAITSDSFPAGMSNATTGACEAEADPDADADAEAEAAVTFCPADCPAATRPGAATPDASTVAPMTNGRD